MTVSRGAPCTGSVASAVYGTGYGTGWVYQGGYYGWVIGGLYRVLPSYREPTADQRPQGAGPPTGRVGRKQAGAGRYRVFGGGDGPRTTTPCGRARALQALSWDLADCRLWANNGEIPPHFH